MKKILLSLSFVLMAFSSFSQSEQYKTSMTGLIRRLFNAQNPPEVYQDLGNKFVNIGEVEKTEWLPKYYASLAFVMQAMATSDKTKVDGILDQADAILSGLAASKSDDEIMCLQAFSKSARINVDPMTRGMKYGGESAKLLSQAKSIDPNNPRVYFLQGQSAFYTPEQFGGGKKVAEKLFLTALEKYDSNAPVADLMPTWGREAANDMVKQCAD
ncbi:MAG: hypothetical protein IPI46_03155 [Bacteroidetes bacterium]|nr:hypothetical protein [Bacteroidota bacterium]